MKIIGREKEIKLLNELYNSQKPELVCIYGRRRVGKTYLIDCAFENRITFRHSGLSPVEKREDVSFFKEQLRSFYNSLVVQGMEPCKVPTNWFDAFLLLEMFLIKKDTGERQVIFLDELPWMDTPKSSFITAFESFWNGWACHRSNIMVIVCGSSTSWILDKLINNYGGLYGRCTHQIKISEFDLREVEKFLNEKQIAFSRYDILQIYMIFGGIPYYLNYLNRELSLAQNIDTLFFAKNAPLANEYDRLFNSIFASPNTSKKIIEVLCNDQRGLSRKEICEKVGVSDGGVFSNVINALIESNFIIKYIPFGNNKREEKYKCVDSFSLFVRKFVVTNTEHNEHYWSEYFESQSCVVWKGFAFEKFCFSHIDYVKRALGIEGVSTSHSSYRSTDKNNGNQIDLVISRNDNIVNVCELKFYAVKYNVDKEEYEKIKARENTIKNLIPKTCCTRNVLISTFGTVENGYSKVFSNIITLEDFF